MRWSGEITDKSDKIFIITPFLFFDISVPNILLQRKEPVKPTEISKLILEKDKIDIRPSMIQLPQEIKSLGKFKAKINLHSEVEAQLNIKVLAEEASQ